MTKLLYIPNGTYIEFYDEGNIFEEYNPVLHNDKSTIEWLEFFCESYTYPNLKDINNIPVNTKLYLSEFEVIYD